MTFEDIYRRNAWNGVETRSGPGSGTYATRALKDALPGLVADLGVRSVLDVGCGEGFWQPDLPGYLGVDVAESAVREARANHPDRIYAVADIRLVVPPPFGLVIVRDVIQHLSYPSAAALIGNIRASGSAYLLASTYKGSPNRDIEDGGFYSPDLTAEPFGLPDPEVLIFDGYAYHATLEPRDSVKFLGLWSLDS